ncbi:MAG: peptidoglycan DD-metalloendopeptidase family protein [Candidatus Nanopelagicales bacterium]
MKHLLPSRSVGIFVILTILVSGLTSPGFGNDLEDELDDIKGQVKELEDELLAASKVVQRATAELRAIEAQIPAAQRRLQTAQSNLKAAFQRESAAEAKIKRINRAQVVVRVRIARAEARVRELQLQVGQIARRLYQEGPLAIIGILFQADSLGEFTGRLGAAQALARARGATVDELEIVRAGLLEDKAELERLFERARVQEELAAAARREAQAARAEAKAARDALAKLQAQRKAAVLKAQKQRDAVKREYDKIRAEQRRIEALIRGEKNPGVFAGTLVWPTTGRISAYPGPRRHPVYGYRSCHTGLDIAAPTGTPIKAAAAGRLVTARSSVYGLYAVIYHGSDVATMYAHMSRFAITSGQVRQGQIIGYVGSTGYSTGPHLHFEVRLKGKAYNPMGWFGAAKKPVSC